MNNIFTKRSGTTSLGRDYEDLNVARIVLKLVTDDNIEDFTLSSNDDKFGRFDDIVFETKSGELTQKYAFQLKHSNDKNRSLTSASLTGEHGDFALSKYFQTFKDIGELGDSYKFIILTNRKVANWDGQEVLFEKQNFSVKLSKENVNTLINNSKASGSCYRFTNIQSKSSSFLSAEQQQYKKFFENFYLYTNQANVFQLETSVSRQFEETFSCTDVAFKRYKEFISKWSIPEGTKEKLNKVQMKRVFALCVLSTSIQPFVFEPVNKRIRLLQRAILTFKITVFKQSASSIVNRIWADRKIELKDRLEEVNAVRKRYQLSFGYIKSIHELNEEDSTKLLWLLGICPLIVTASRSSYEIIELCNTDKFVLLRNGSNEDLLDDRSIFQDLADLNPSSEIYKNITRTFKYSVQGKEECLLESLLEENRDFRKHISTDDLLLMSERKIYVVGGEKEPLPTPYISRYLTRNIIDTNYLKKVDDNTIVVIDCLSKSDEIKRDIRNFNLIEVNECLSHRRADSVNSERSNSFTKIDRNADLTASTSGPDLYITQNECSREDFKAMSRLKTGIETSHHLRSTDDGNLEWIRSLNNIDDLQPFHLECGSTKESRLCDTSDKINVIIGEPGMGKSVLMRNLKNNTSSTFWTIIFHTEDISSLLTFLNGQRLKPSSFRDYLLNVKYAHLRRFDKKILNMSIQENHVVYIWDAVDEISSADLELISDIILELSKKNVSQWVTCRCHLKNYLERKFRVFSKKIIQFSEVQQVHYIEKRLVNNTGDILRGKVEKIKTLIVHHEILGIPLQIFMLTELFREDADKYSNVSNDIFNVTDLYEYFLDEKFNIYYKKSFRKITGLNREQILGDHRKNRFTYYQKAALRALVGSLSNEFSDSDEFLREIQQKGDLVGIITEVTDDMTPHFIHKSFAEYFVALHFVKCYKSIGNFQSMIFDNTRQNIRFFFDLLMAKSSPANIAVLYKNIDMLQVYEGELEHCKDLGRRNVLHTACSWGQQYPSFPVSHENSTYVIDTSSEKNYSVSKEDPKYVEMLLYLLDRCNVSERDELFNYTSLAYAEKTKSLFAKAIILQNQNRKIPTFSDDDEGMASVLYYAAKFGYTDFISWYETFPFIKTEDGSTYLHLSVGQEKFFLELLKIDVYRTTIDDRDANGLTALGKACQQGQYSVVEHLLGCEASINTSSNDGRTPLHYACQFGHYDIALLLIKTGTNIDIKDNKFWTPFHLACYNGHVEVATLLLGEGADANLANHDGWTPLHSACINGHHKVVELLIRCGIKANVHRRSHKAEDVNWTPLHSASWHGHDKVVELLLGIGMDSNITTNYNRTPLHYACEKGHEKVVQILCMSEYGTNVNVETDEGWTPLHFASDNGYHGIVKVLIAAGSLLNVRGSESWTPLHIAALKGHTKIASLLLENHADPESESEDGRTPLHYASQLGHEQIVKLLTENKCNVNATDKKGLTPLHLSCKEKQDKVVKILTDCKADVDAATQKKKTALHYACQNGHDDAVQLLLISHADIEVPDSRGITPLHLACHNGHEKIVQLLIIAQAKLNKPSKDGWTALHYVSHSGHVKIAKQLRSSGADINSTIAANGWTPLYIASLNGHDEIVHFLLDHGVSSNDTTKKGRTPLHAASENNHYRVASSLIDHRADIDSFDEANWTPLHVACKQGHSEIVQLLVNSGGNINAATENGWTPLHLACLDGNSKMCEQLLKYRKIDIEATDNEKKTPLYLACQYGHKAIYHMLIAASAKISVSANDGSTLIHAACRYGRTEIVEILVKELNDLNIRDIKGCTSLHYASENGLYEIVDLLINEKTNVDAKDDEDRTPLHIACEKGHEKIVERLLGAGAKVNISTTWGMTPVYLASRNDHKPVIALINKRLKEEARCCILT